MKLSTKGRYAVTAMADLALHAAPDTLVSLGQISERQGISLAYLEQLFSRLRKAKLVESARGPGGGYRLAKAAGETRISEIMEAVDETLNAANCEALGCGTSRAACLTHDLWEQLSAQVYLFLHGVTLADVVEKRLEPCGPTTNFLALIEEEAAAARKEAV